MADTTLVLNAGSGGTDLAGDDDATTGFHQYIKLKFGASATQTTVTSTVGLPVNLVQQTGAAITVDGSGVTQPVSGTITANLSATDNAVLDAIAASVAGTLTVDGSGVTQPVSGTVTANLSATDNAVLDTIVTNTNNLTNCIVQDDAPFTPATGYLMMVGGEFDDAAPDSVDEGDAGNFRMSANRCQYVNIRDNAGNERGLNVDTNGDIGITNAGLTELAAAINSSRVDVNIAANGLPSSSFIDDGDWTALTSYHTLIGGIYQSTPGSITDGDSGPLRMTVNGEAHVSLTTALPAGANAIGKLAANSGVDIGDVDILSIATGSNLIGDVGLGVRTSGGATPYCNDGTCALTQIKGSAGQIYSISVTNKTSAILYLQLFNSLSASVTLGTTTPTNEYHIPHNSGNGGGQTFSLPVPRAYGTGISYAITTTKSGATPATADDALLNLDYA